MDFTVDKQKAIEALVYVACKWRGVGRFHAAKILYFAERSHLRAYGRPILGDRYIAMENGPVPSFAYDVLKGTLPPELRSLTEGAIVPIDSVHHPAYEAGRKPRLEYFSKSDLDCLDQAIAYCLPRSFGVLSDETHLHKAWADADLNGPMRWEHFLEEADTELIEEAKAFAAYGVL